MSNSSYNKVVNEFNSLEYIKDLKKQINKSSYNNIFYLKKDDYCILFNEIIYLKYNKEILLIQNDLLTNIVYEKGIVDIINQYTDNNKYNNVVFELEDIFHNIKYIDCERVLCKFPYSLISYIERLDTNNDDYLEDYPHDQYFCY